MADEVGVLKQQVGNMALVEAKKSYPDVSSDPRRGSGEADGAYLKLVGERVRLLRSKLGMSRKSLSKESGVSERYLAELERGTGNASLLVLRSIAHALHVKVADLVYEVSDQPVGANDLGPPLSDMSTAEAG